MDVIGQRILIFGDSLSHHGADDDPEIWNTDAGSNRISSAPGDLLASHLLEQGAEATRVNANVSRSAPNFWRGGARYQFHTADQLIADDRAWKPTKVIVMLGTNDADTGAFDPAAMQKIRDTYAAMGAEVWAVGPPVFTSEALNKRADQVFKMMQGVFGGRLIDARPLSSKEDRANDGVHFQPQSASIVAMQIVSGLMNAKPPKPLWIGIALGVGVFGLFGYLLWKNHKTGSLGDFDMLKVIASESRTPEEYARRAEAWASSESRPPSITKIASYYRKAAPARLASLVREARKKRERLSRQRHEGFVSQRDEDEDDLEGPQLDRRIAQQSLKEERAAIRAYTKRVSKVESAKLKKALRHARKEEREHAAAFRPLTGDSKPSRTELKKALRRVRKSKHKHDSVFETLTL